MNNSLSDNQAKMLEIFYDLPATKVVYDKKARTKLWKKASAKNMIPDISSINIKSPALAHQISKSYESGKNIQSAIFSECSYAQTLANMLSLTKFINCLDSNFSFPRLANETITNNNLAPRYVYTNAPKTRMLIQAGGHGGIDCAYVSIDENNAYTIEFKEPGAKTSEPDLPKYREDGDLLVTPKFLEDYPQFKEMLEDQKGLNFFAAMGNNIHDFKNKSVDIAVSNNYLEKFADVICTEDTNGYLVMIPANQVSLWANLEGEIRPAGRNHYKVWTPKALTRFLEEKGATFSHGKATISIDHLEARTERGGNGKISGYKINPLFFVRLKDCVLDGNAIVFDISKVQQLNPTIAGKMFFKGLVYDSVKNYYVKQTNR